MSERGSGSEFPPEADYEGEKAVALGSGLFFAGAQNPTPLQFIHARLGDKTDR